MDRKALLKRILKKIKTGRIDSAGVVDVNKIDFSANIKYDFLDEGKMLLVHDVPIAKEMVQQYSDGYHYKTKEAIDGILVEYSPIAVSHPSRHFRELSEQEQIDKTIGYMIDGCTKENKKYADLVFFVDKTPKKVIDNIKDQKSIDVSIGFFVDIDETPGEFEGKHYDKKQIKINIDHLGVLPGGEGRASFPDGVGIGADSRNDSSLSIRKILNGLIVSKFAGDRSVETYYPNESAAREDLDIGELFDKKINEVVKTTEGDVKDYKEALKRNAELGSELKDSQKTVESQNTKIDALEKELKDYKEKNKEVIDKAEKYDTAIKKQTEEEDANKVRLTDEILKHPKARKDDGFKEFIENKDAKDLQFMLDDLNSKINGLPAKKKDVNNPSQGEHMADTFMREKFEKANEGSKVI